MQRIALIMLLAFFTTGLIACDKEQKEAEQAEATETAEATGEEATAPAEELPQADVAKEGTTFNPPIQPSQLPDGVYFCDMGTVHYAQTEKGDNKCPLCNMMLTQKGGADKATAHGHDHDHDHDHDHAH